MRVIICYFSGTGNTRKVANKYVESFEKFGHSAEAISIEEYIAQKSIPDALAKQLNQADIIGFGYPIHAFNVPHIMISFAKQLPKLSPKKAFVFSTSGEPLKLNNISSAKLYAILKRRNIRVVYERRYCMPYNIMFRHSDEMAYKMWSAAEQLVPIDVNEIIDGKTHKLAKVTCGGFVAWVMRCEQWGAHLVGKTYKVSDACVNCLKCVNNCPTGNIKIAKNKIKFGGKCIMCMRCAHLCPTGALKMGIFEKWRVNGAYSFTKPAKEQHQKYNKMLTEAYKKYFADSNKRIEEYIQSEKSKN